MKLKDKTVIHNIKDSLMVISCNTEYMKEMGFASDSCRDILKGVKRIIEILKQVD